MRYVKRLGAIWLIWFLLTPAFSNAQGESKKQVLVLHSYHQGYRWTDDITEGIEAVLGVERQDIELQIEYMDTKRIFDEAYIQRLVGMYSYKFSERQFDVIISSDDNAFNFLLEYRDELFPGTPVVFCGVNFFSDDKLQGYELFTGVNEEADIKGGLEIALKLHPDTRRVFVVNDTTTTGLTIHGKLMELIPTYQDRLEFVLLEDVEMTEIQETVSRLLDDSLVFYTLFLGDGAGQFFEFDESISMITQQSAVPVYGAWDFSLGYGIVGGLLTSGYYQGETAAQQALRILEGESVQNVPVVKQSPNRYMFDYEQMQRFGINRSDLPQDSILINEPTSFYSRYGTVLWIGAISILVLSLIVFYLVANIFRRRRAEGELRQLNIELQTARETLEQRITDRTAESERRAVQLEAAAKVAHVTTLVLDPGELLRQVVDLVQDRFDLYYVGLFLLDEAQQTAVLRAGTGEAGRQMIARGHRLEIGGGSMIGQCVARSQARIALDVGEEAVRFDNPFLPDTRSELALPLRSRGQVIGAMTVQSAQESAFDEAYIAVLQTMADQVAITIANAQLFAETQAALEQVERTQQHYLGQAWGQYARTREVSGYQGAKAEILPLEALPDDLEQVLQQATIEGRAVAQDSSDNRPAAPSVLVSPIMLRGQPIGVVGFRRPGEQAWSKNDIAFAQMISEQFALAADNLRLFEETQRRAAQERLTREIVDNIRGAVSIQDAIQRTVQEMGRVLGASEVVARVGIQDTPGVSQEGDGHE